MMWIMQNAEPVMLRPVLDLEVNSGAKRPRIGGKGRYTSLTCRKRISRESFGTTGARPRVVEVLTPGPERETEIPIRMGSVECDATVSAGTG